MRGVQRRGIAQTQPTKKSEARRKEMSRVEMAIRVEVIWSGGEWVGMKKEKKKRKEA